MQDLSSSYTFAVELLQVLLYKASVKTFVKHRPISCSKERKPRDKILLTSVWDVTKTRNVGSKNKHWEREIEKIGTKQRIGNEVTVRIFHFPVSHSLSPLPVPRSPWYPLRLNQSILWGQNLVVLLRFMAHDSPGYAEYAAMYDIIAPPYHCELGLD